MAARSTILACLQETLQPERFSDYCPNGLQIEGKHEIEHLVTGVTACQALIDAAIAVQADALLVHHGFFWKNEAPQLVGIKHRRIRSLLLHDINLFAYHLPLDAHPVLGNNAQLATRLGISIEGYFGEQNLALYGTLDDPHPPLQTTLQQCLQRPVQVLGDVRPIRRIGLCTGAAQNFLTQAAALGLDAFISGEVSESSFHIAQETGIQYFVAGHHATERYGVQAVGDWLAGQFGIRHQFIDIDNPV